MMGDIYTDLAAAVVGKSLGLMPSSEVNADGFGNYQQIAGSAPDIAGKGVANPIAEIRSAAMMLEDFGYPEAAQRIYGAITKALSIARTPDIHEEGFKKVGTQEMGDLIVQLMRDR
jgi:3-isopropylmalate dehydrogenase